MEKKRSIILKGLAFVERLSEKSLIKTKNNSYSSMAPWGTPALILDDWEILSS